MTLLRKLRRWCTSYRIGAAAIVLAAFWAGLAFRPYLSVPSYLRLVLPAPTPAADMVAIGSPVRENSSQYHYINPLLLCDLSQPMATQEFQPFQNQVTSYIAGEVTKGDISTASVYFRDLEHGQWTTVNPDEKYSPASLLKVPIMIAVYKEAEGNPNFLKKRILYDGSFDENGTETYKPPVALKAGQSYTIDELVEHMIADSDNNAAELLYDNLDTDFLNQVFSDVGLDFPPNQADVSFMTVKDYSYFFRLLYNSTYLIRPYSEEALKYLVESDFPQGIEAGVPAGTDVANKFGERTVYADQSETTVDERELHDCGIIYYPGHPYLLCVMTRGTDFAKLTNVIQTVTKMSWRMAEDLYGN